MKTLLLTFFLTSSAFAQYTKSEPKPQNENEKLVIAALDHAFNKQDLAFIDQNFRPDYIQHNPHVKNGSESLKGYIKTIPKGFKFEPGFVTSNGNIVMIHSRYSSPTGKVNVVVDIFRIEEGKIAEHWDTGQEEVPTKKTASGNPMFR